MNINCSICQRIFPSYQSLSAHIKGKHLEITIKQYYDMFIGHKSCGICFHCKINPTRFITLKAGYVKYCSLKCAAISTVPGRIHSNKTKQSIKQSMINAHANGVFPIQLRELKRKQTTLQRYGVDQVMKVKSIQDKAIETRSHNHNYHIYTDHFTPSIGLYESQILDLQEQKDKCVIDRSFRVGRYWPDGYCKDTNTIYEVYEPYHKYTIDKDQKRQQYIEKRLNCRFIILYQRDYLNAISQNQSEENCQPIPQRP